MEKKYNILVIEDDPDIGSMIKMILSHRGYTVSVLQDASLLFDLMSAKQTDVVIMDMFLSGSNGTDICKKLKNDNSLAHIPLIMMSAHPDAERLCKNAGADDFIYKPFDLDMLFDKIENVLISKPLTS